MKINITAIKRMLAAMAAAAITTAGAHAAQPANYYQPCEGKTGQELLQALAKVVSAHTNVGYDGLWEVYETSDVRPDGTLWDMYSTKKWPSNFKQCGNYKLVGDCVNREHSFPKSWWGGGKQTQYSDAYHLYPTDGKVNGQRSNYPFGECSGGTSLAANGNVKPLGRLGKSTFPGYSGTVFEPDDQYKGDFARTYFYLAAAYNNVISRWTQGNGGEMLAGNPYPVFRQWALDMLLKWSRQDPVSTKELNRNEAVCRHQKNRNPFIDHPELAEYIWGNKKGIAWYADAASGQPQINLPADGTTINIGLTSTGLTRSVDITVKSTSLTADVQATVSGNGFSATPAHLSAREANTTGATLTLSYTSATPGKATGELTLTSGDATCHYPLAAQAVEGLPVAEATDITENSFTIHWTSIDPADTPYTIAVTQAGKNIDGYPRRVAASQEQHTVENLEPETTYTFTVSNATITSTPHQATTQAPTPSIQLLYDGDLSFVTLPGEPSETAELLIDAENIDGDITVTVEAPFAVSTDKATWSTTTTLTPDEDRFYLRLHTSTCGTYETPITLSAGDYVNDTAEATGTVTDSFVDFAEDFEAPAQSGGNYNDKTYTGTAATWQTNALFERGTTNSHPHSGEQAARTGKSGTRHLTMLQTKPNGIGTVSFWARLWGTDSTAAKFELQTSADDGQTWTTAGTIEVPPHKPAGDTNEYAEFTLSVNQSGPRRLRLLQTAGARTLIDDITITSHGSQNGVNQANRAEYHTWDAYCRQGRLMIESANGGEYVEVYSADGICHMAATLTQGTTALALQPGLYLVTANDFTRRVVVK